MRRKYNYTMNYLSILLIVCGILQPIYSIAQKEKITNSHYKIIKEHTVFFEFEKHNVGKKDQKILREMANYMEEHVDAFVTISSHTDSVGPAAWNKVIAQKRAGSIVLEFQKRGIENKRIEMKVEGETGASKGAKNRRANVLLFDLSEKTIGTVEVVNTNVLETNKTIKDDKTIVGNVIDEKTGELLTAAIELHVEKDFLPDTIRTEDNSFSISKDFMLTSVNALSKGYMPYSRSLKPDDIKDNELLIKLEKIEKGKKIILNEVFFQEGTIQILPESEVILSEIVLLLKLNPTLRLKVEGHISVPNIEPEKLSNKLQALSLNRAYRIRYFLIVNGGIDGLRLDAEGMGNSKMIYPNAESKAEIHANERVEIEVIDF